MEGRTAAERALRGRRRRVVRWRSIFGYLR
jgi:hypothetical protein